MVTRSNKTDEIGGEAPFGAFDEPSTPPQPSRQRAPSRNMATQASEEIQGCSLIAEMDRPLSSPSVILVPRVQALREGSTLVGPVTVGRLLGAGLQARVHELVLRDGTPTGKVIKIAHTDIGHKTLNAVSEKIQATLFLLIL